MNHGSIESRSSATSAVDLFGVRASTSEFSTRSQSAGDRFDSIFDNLSQRSWANTSYDNGIDNGASLPCGNSSGLLDECRNEPTSSSESEPSENRVSNEMSDDSDDGASSISENAGSETPSVDDSSKSESPDVEDNGDSGSGGESEDSATDANGDEDGLDPNASAKSAKEEDVKSTKGRETRAVKTTETAKVSSSKSFQLQTQKVTVVKDGEAEKADKTTVLHNEAAKTAKAEVKVAEVSSDKDLPKVSQAKVGAAKALDETSGKDASVDVGKLKAALKAGVKRESAQKAEVKTDATQEGAVKKNTNRPAKTSTTVQASVRAEDTSLLKNPLKTAGLQGESRLAQVGQEIGIKTAEQAVTKQNKMVAEVKQSDTVGSEKGFLKEGNGNGALNRAQAVNSRSEMGGFFSQSQNGDSSRGDAQQHSRGGEQFRQWVEGSSEVRGVSQAAHQTELVDRAVGSLLSGRVLNQIVNHIEKLRESEKNRVKVSLGSEANGVTVDIRIEGDAIYTTFEGDPQILNQLKDEWDDIKDRATAKGVSLTDPEFIEISYSSSSEGNSLLPDDGIAKEEKSQSVIQHKNNQPVRPGEMTAAAGSSGPVHSFYA